MAAPASPRGPAGSPPEEPATAAAVFPCPVFEGSEKRISVTFAPGPGAPLGGLRALSRAQLDGLLDLAACQIVSSRSNARFDAYVLSESSLFVYPGGCGGVWVALRGWVAGWLGGWLAGAGQPDILNSRLPARAAAAPGLPSPAALLRRLQLLKRRG